MQSVTSIKIYTKHYTDEFCIGDDFKNIKYEETKFGIKLFIHENDEQFRITTYPWNDIKKVDAIPTQIEIDGKFVPINIL